MGGSKSSSVTVGYRYFMTIHFGLARGPIDEIVEIRVGDKQAWPLPEGTSGPKDTPITDDRVTQINAPKLFGGDKKEGGIQGSLTVCMGKATQIFPAWVKNLMGGRVPDFRGVTTMVFDGMICALNPYPKTWKIRQRRVLAGWDGAVWRPDTAVIWLSSNTIKAMNPAHILYECATNRDWGRGLPRGRLDDTSWTIAAQKLKAEGFGLCLRWNRQEELHVFAQNVVEHIGGAIYIDKSSGLLTLKLIRDDYDADNLDLYTYDKGLISIEPDASAREQAINEVIIKYKDPIKDEERSLRAQNLASIQSIGSINSTTTDYTGLPTGSLAGRVAERDLKTSTTGVKRYTVTLDRRAWRMAPGDVFAVSAPEKGIQRVILRAGKIEDGPLTDGKIRVSAVIDVFGLADTSFVNEQESEWQPLDPTPTVITDRYIREATYVDTVRILSAADLQLVDPLSGATSTLAARPSETATGYNILTRIGSEEFVERGSESWAPIVFLSAAVGPYDETLSFGSYQDMGNADVGSLLQLDDEIVQVTSITLEDDGNTGSLGILRGCVDTIPVSHSIGAKGYFIDENLGYDSREYTMGESVDVKLQSVTSSAELDISLAPTDILNIVARQGRPYPPGDVKVGGLPALSNPVVSGFVSITWAHRDRLTQLDQIVSHGDPSVGPEEDTDYNIRFYNTSGSLIRSQQTVSGDSFDLGPGDLDLVGNFRVELESIRDGRASFQKYSFFMTRTL